MTLAFSNIKNIAITKIGRAGMLFTLVVMFLLFSNRSYATLVIDSATTTISTCANNGSIKVYVHSTDPLILYSIIAGAVIQPQQTNSIFNSLPAGTYTIKAENGAGESATQDVTIAGNYQPLDFSPIPVGPYCLGGNDAQIIGNLTPATGAGPFTWQLIAPSPVVVGPQSSDTLKNLSPGDYLVKVTDACGSYATLAVNVPDYDAIYALDYPIGTAEPVACDSVGVVSRFYFPAGEARLPLTFKIKTKNGIYIPPANAISIDSTNLSSFGSIDVRMVIPGITYGDSINATAYNSCGDSGQNYTFLIAPYVFYPVYTTTGCGTKTNVTFKFNVDIESPNTGLQTPVTYSLVNTATHAVTDAGVLTASDGDSYYGMVTTIPIGPYVAADSTYTLTVTDGCGKVFTSPYTIPSYEAPAIFNDPSYTTSCLDSSSGLLNVIVTGMGGTAKLIIVSGPPFVQSTKPHYAYHDNYVYPDTLAVSGTETVGNVNMEITQDIFGLQHLVPGVYYVKAIDTCYEVEDSFTVAPSDITDLEDSFYYTLGCAGQNKIYYSYKQFPDITVRNIGTNAILANTRYFSPVERTDSVVNVPPGSYELTLDYEQGYSGTAINENDECWTVKDTITIPTYQQPLVKTTNYITCKAGADIEVVPDSSKGVVPYLYSIVMGPQVFPDQTSPIFPVTQNGTSLVTITDGCGNAATAFVTVDGLSYPPVIPIQSTCTSAKLYYGSSAYYTYQWTKPNGTVYIGDTLVVNPITPADTGNYSILRIVHIDGCVDTLDIAEHLSLGATFMQTVSLCNVSPVVVGIHSYTIPGVYRDTLINGSVCGDSIVVTTVTAGTCISVTAAATDISCGKKNGSITATGIDGAPPYSYSIDGGVHYQSSNLFNALDSGAYIVTIKDQNLSTDTASVYIHYAPGLVVDIGNDTLLCLGKSLNLSVNIPGVYTWQDGSTNSFYHVAQAGQYWVSVSAGGCMAADTINVSYVSSGNVLSTNDTATCIGNTIVLTALYPNALYVWDDNSTQQTRSVNSSGKYWLTVSAHGCSESDTVFCTFITPPAIDLGNDTTLCNGAQLTLRAGNSANYLWNDNSTADTLLVNQPGRYWADATVVSGCTNSDTIQVSYISPPVFSLGNDTTVCSGASVLLHAPLVASYQYFWQDNSTANNYTATIPGMYFAKVTDQFHCAATDSININFNSPPVVDLGSDTSLCTGEQLLLNVYVPQVTYLWQDGSVLPTYTVTADGHYTVGVTNSCGTSNASINVQYQNCDCVFYIPSAFSPKGDIPENAIFKPAYNCIFSNYALTVYNRWGQLVFTSTDGADGWDGNYNGVAQPQGAYIWMLTYVDTLTAKLITKRGTVVLVR